MNTTQQPVRVLPANVYDALEFSALAFGGIGGGAYESAGAPLCAVGHARAVQPGHWSVEETVRKAGIDGCENDAAVLRINKNASYARVPFESWCKELNVVRGE